MFDTYINNINNNQNIMIVIGKRAYNLTILLSGLIAENNIKMYIDECFKNLKDKNNIEIINYGNIIRYEIAFKKKLRKSNMISLLINLDKSKPDVVKNIMENAKNNKKIFYYMLQREKINYTRSVKHKAVKTSNPLVLKKFLLESQRIMPRELSCMNNKEQRILSKSIKRIRQMGLLLNNKMINNQEYNKLKLLSNKTASKETE